jgi:hypothetical protein
VSTPRLSRRWPVVIVPLVVLAAFVAVAPRVFVDPARAEHVSFENRSAYAMEIEVTGAKRDGWLRLGTAERGSTTVVADVVDQGDEWIFRFGSQGLDGGETRVGKAELVRDGWRVTIPDSIAEHLAAQGAPPTPPVAVG